MKKLLIFSASIFLFQFYSFTQSELVNVNPDPNGDPWYVSQFRTLTVEDYEFLNSLNKLSIPEDQKGKDLPAVVDNSSQPYFRPIFSQEGGSCGQACGIGYIFTYEIDWIRGLAANTLVTQYPTHYTWNFLNGGVGNGSWEFDGWRIIQSNGCPNVEDWGGHFAHGGQSRWMSGYENYYNGMSNKVFEISSIYVGNQQGLEVFKNWIFDHLDGSDEGGVTSFGAGLSNTYTMSNLPEGTPEAGKHVVIHWDQLVNHGMTFVGYNDEIRYDFNNDGQYTNHLDINGDGIVNMKDWEIGGVKFANSWGTQFADSGFAYTMYKNLAESVDNGGIWSNTLHTVSAKETYDPIMTFKVNLKHNSREKIKIIAGVSNDLSSIRPENYLDFDCFNYQGGDFYMQGGNTNSDKYIEIGLDITPLLSYVNSGDEVKFFIGVIENDPYNNGDGEIVNCSLMDYSNGVEETICAQQNVPLINNDSTFLSISKLIEFDKVEITTDELPSASVNVPYSQQLDADGGVSPYRWSFRTNYTEEVLSASFPNIPGQQLFPSNNDDGFVTQQLDFSFPFYQQEYDQITILTDGAIVFDDNYIGIRTEEDVVSNKCLTAYCADLMIYPKQNDGIWFVGDESGAIIRWQTSKYNEPLVFIEMAITIYPSGLIRFHYGNNNTEGLKWASGLSKGDDESYTISQISNSNTFPDNYASKFFPLDYPNDMQISSDGIFSCTPLESDKSWDISFVATDNSNIFTMKTLEFSTLITSIEDNQNILIPSIINVTNYPNPFSKTTTIAFTLDKASSVNINIYDIMGKKVFVLKNHSFYYAGTHTVDLDANALENGVYFYQIETEDGSSQLRKMCISK